MDSHFKEKCVVEYVMFAATSIRAFSVSLLMVTTSDSSNCRAGVVEKRIDSGESMKVGQVFLMELSGMENFV